MYSRMRVSGLVLIVILLSTGLSLGLVAGKGKKKRNTYEYSLIIVMSTKDASQSVYQTCDQEGNVQYVKAKNMIELCKKTGIKGDGGLHAFMNYLGSKGWILVTIERLEDEERDGGVVAVVVSQTYYFRRSR